MPQDVNVDLNGGVVVPEGANQVPADPGLPPLVAPQHLEDGIDPAGLPSQPPELPQPPGYSEAPAQAPTNPFVVDPNGYSEPPAVASEVPHTLADAPLSIPETPISNVGTNPEVPAAPAQPSEATPDLKTGIPEIPEVDGKEVEGKILSQHPIAAASNAASPTVPQQGDMQIPIERAVTDDLEVAVKKDDLPGFRGFFKHLFDRNPVVKTAQDPDNAMLDARKNTAVSETEVK